MNLWLVSGNGTIGISGLAQYYLTFFTSQDYFFIDEMKTGFLNFPVTLPVMLPVLYNIHNGITTGSSKKGDVFLNIRKRTAGRNAGWFDGYRNPLV